MKPCHCQPLRAAFRRPSVPFNAGLGFTMPSIDWGGIVGNAVKAYGVVAQTRATIKLQQAQQAAALRAQEAEIQAMQRRAAQTVAQPADGGFAVTTVPRAVAAAGSQFPPWMIPAALGGLALIVLLRR